MSFAVVGATFAAGATATHYSQPIYQVDTLVDDCTGLTGTIVFAGTDVGTRIDNATGHHNSVHYTGTITITFEDGSWGTGTEHFVGDINILPNVFQYHTVDYQTIAIYNLDGTLNHLSSFRVNFTFDVSGDIVRVEHENFRDTTVC